MYRFECFSAVWHHHRFWQLPSSGLFKSCNKQAERQTSSMASAHTPPLPSPAYQVLLLSNSQLTCSRECSVKHTYMHTDHRAVCLSHSPATRASWLSALTQSRRNSHRLLCSRSGCHGWAATWTAGEDVSTAWLGEEACILSLTHSCLNR